MKIFNNKEGVERWMLIMIILAVICFAIILLFLYITKPYSVVDKEACRTSIRLRSIAIAGEPLKAAAPLQCKTEQITIDSSYKTEDQIKEKIANSMAECWSMVGKGELIFMPKDFAGQKYCLICSRIEFDEKTKKDFPVVSGFLKYMNEEKFQDEKTYYNYIFGDAATFSGKNDFNIDTSKDYAITFSLYQPGYLGSIAGGLLGGGIAIFGIGTGGIGTLVIGGIGAILGELTQTQVLSFFHPNGMASIHVIPYKGEEIEKYCTRFENAP